MHFWRNSLIKTIALRQNCTATTIWKFCSKIWVLCPYENFGWLTLGQSWQFGGREFWTSRPFVEIFLGVRFDQRLDILQLFRVQSLGTRYRRWREIDHSLWKLSLSSSDYVPFLSWLFKINVHVYKKINFHKGHVIQLSVVAPFKLLFFINSFDTNSLETGKSWGKNPRQTNVCYYWKSRASLLPVRKCCRIGHQWVKLVSPKRYLNQLLFDALHTFRAFVQLYTIGDVVLHYFGCQ